MKFYFEIISNNKVIAQFVNKSDANFCNDSLQEFYPDCNFMVNPIVDCEVCISPVITKNKTKKRRK